MTAADDDEERTLRIELMVVQIDKGRLDIKRLEQEIRMENRKFLVQLVLAITAALGVGIAIGRFALFHT